jgi:tetratricopeptide (TPR) repeat protein
VNFIGITETRLGRIKAANKDLRDRRHAGYGSAGIAQNLGFNDFGQGQYDLAEKQLKAALTLNGADPFVHYYLAILYLSTSRDREAIVHIKPAESMLENDTATGMLAISACLRSNASAEALTFIELLGRRS